jgi:NADPH-dependent curcumin reductase CurA
MKAIRVHSVILTQWAKHLGAIVIGTVGSPEKAEIARQNGCDHVIDYHKKDFAEACLLKTQMRSSPRLPLAQRSLPSTEMA